MVTALASALAAAACSAPEICAKPTPKVKQPRQSQKSIFVAPKPTVDFGPETTRPLLASRVAAPRRLTAVPGQEGTT